MSRQAKIEEILKSVLRPSHLEVHDESAMHSRGNDSHFKIVCVADAFHEKSRIARHRMVHEALGDLFKSGLHAITLSSFSPDEWEAGACEDVIESPGCASKKPR